MTELTRLTMPLDVDAAFAVIERDGAVIVEGFLDTATVSRLRGDFAPDLEVEDPGSRSDIDLHRNFHGARTKRLCGLAARSPAFVELMLRQEMHAYAERFLSAAADDYWLNTGPGEPEQMLHRDEDNWPSLPADFPEVTVSSMFALSDFTAEAGATRVVPGSHRWPSRRRPEPSEIVQAVMPAGSVLFYTGKVIHGAGANRTDRWRHGMHLSYVVAWLRPEEHHFLHVPEKLARTLPERAQALLGWTTYVPERGGRLGLVDFQEVTAQAPE